MMAPVSVARFWPFCAAKFAEAFENPPPWIHTMTGAPAAGTGFGVQTLSIKQSSTPVGCPVAALSCAQDSGAVIALSVDGAHAAAGWGRFHRRLPVGGAANGIPRKAHDDPRSSP